MNVANPLWRQVRSDDVLCLNRGRIASYGEVRGIARAVVGSLKDREVGAGDRVAILLERGSDAIASYFGTLAAGATVVVLQEALRPRQVERALSDSGARLLVTSHEMLDRLPRPIETATEVLDIATLASVGSSDAMSDAPPVTDRGSDSGAQIVYTSGSTGLPRGVVLTHGNLSAHARIVAGYLGLSPTDRTISLLPFGSVYGISQLLCTVATGGALVIERSPIASRIGTTVREEAITVIAGVPALWLQLLQSREFADRPAPALRIVQNAGGHLPVAAVRALRAAQPQATLFLMYGMTEAMRCTYLPPTEVDRRPDSMGRALAETEILVVRPDDSLCGPGETGELVVAGPTVGLGYWNDSEASRDTFRPDPRTGAGRVVYSGDLVRQDSDGFLYFVGRRDCIIKSLGHRVGPDEVVEALLASGLVVEAAVTSEPDAVRGQRIVAHVVLRPAARPEVLASFCRSELPRWLQPARFQLHESLPRTAGGKYDMVHLARPTDRLRREWNDRACSAGPIPGSRRGVDRRCDVGRPDPDLGVHARRRAAGRTVGLRPDRAGDGVPRAH